MTKEELRTKTLNCINDHKTWIETCLEDGGTFAARRFLGELDGAVRLAFNLGIISNEEFWEFGEYTMNTRKTCELIETVGLQGMLRERWATQEGGSEN